VQQSLLIPERASSNARPKSAGRQATTGSAESTVVSNNEAGGCVQTSGRDRDQTETALLPAPFWCTYAWNRPTSTGAGGSDPLWHCWRGKPLARDPLARLRRIQMESINFRPAAITKSHRSIGLLIARARADGRPGYVGAAAGTSQPEPANAHQRRHGATARAITLATNGAIATRQQQTRASSLSPR
jgi:hypothetical protein